MAASIQRHPGYHFVISSSADKNKNGAHSAPVMLPFLDVSTGRAMVKDLSLGQHSIGCSYVKPSLQSEQG